MRHCECAVKLSLVYKIESLDRASKNKHKYSNNEGSSTPSPWLRILAHKAGKKSNNRKKKQFFDYLFTERHNSMDTIGKIEERNE